jgi:hypothetical protein
MKDGTMSSKRDYGTDDGGRLQLAKGSSVTGDLQFLGTVDLKGIFVARSLPKASWWPIAAWSMVPSLRRPSPCAGGLTERLPAMRRICIPVHRSQDGSPTER